MSKPLRGKGKIGKKGKKLRGKIVVPIKKGEHKKAGKAFKIRSLPRKILRGSRRSIRLI